MTTELQIKIGSDPMQTSFIRENPYWYKRLNRNPNSYKDFIADMKNKYKIILIICVIIGICSILVGSIAYYRIVVEGSIKDNR